MLRSNKPERLLPHEERAVREAIPAWLAANASILNPSGTHRNSRVAKFRGETAEAVLERHGIRHGKSFTGDYERYGVVESELRRRARLRQRVRRVK